LYSDRVALIATVLFCWVPSSLFFLAPYSEGLFALEIVVVLALLERERYLAAAVVAGIASATSPESVALTLAIVVAAVLARRAWYAIVGYAVVSGLGLFCYMGFLWVRFSNPFEFVSVQRDWRRSEHFPFVGLYRNILALRHFLVGPGPAPGGSQVTFANFRAIWVLDDAALVVAALLVFALAYMCWTRRPAGGWWAPVAHLVPDAAGEVAVAGETPLAGEPARADGVDRPVPADVADAPTGRVVIGADTPSEKAPIPVSFVVVSFVIVLLAACTTISPYAQANWASSEGEARFVSIAMPLYVGAALVLRRSAGLIAFAIGTSVVLALVFQALFNLGYWVT
jgi:hypothetical protein